MRRLLVTGAALVATAAVSLPGGVATARDGGRGNDLDSDAWDGVQAGTPIPPSDPDAVDEVMRDDTAALPEQAEQVDLAPTFGWLLGVPDRGRRDGGPAQWQGRVLAEAFDRRPRTA